MDGYEYQVRWHTQPCMAHPVYRGTKTVWARNEEQAAEKGQREAHRDFREYSLGHIVIDEVSRKF